ncbi:MAG: peptidyl-prolyl cis-trans isomerase [Treponema sp.]|nr:peptidyl-prolyl cis-trans isomerase [Treponema sp.]
MKKGLYSIGGIIILLIAAFIFVLVPALAGGAGQNRLPAYGSYNGVPIKFEEGTEFYSLANQAVQRMEQQGYSFSGDYASFFYSMAFSQAFNQVVGPMALRDLTAKSGWLASDTAIDRALINQYYNESGEFSQALYNATPDDTKRKYQEQVVDALTAGRSYEDLFGSFASFGKEKLYGLKRSAAELEFIRKMGSDVHEYEYVAFSMKTFPDEKTKEFAKSKSDKLTKYDLAVITVNDENKAKDVLKRISNSEITFEDAVTSYSTKSIGDSESGKITTNRQYQIEGLLKDKAKLVEVTSLAKDAHSAPVELENGWAIFKCLGASESPNFDNEEDLKAATNYIYSHEKGIVQDYYTAQANDFIASAATNGYNEACAKFGLEKQTTPSFALNWNNTTLVGKSNVEDKAELKGAMTNENFLTSAFKLGEGEVSSPIVLSSTDSIVVLRCVGISQGGTSAEDAPRLIGEEIANADSVVVNSAIQNSPKIKSNSAEFMAVFSGEKQ